MTTPTVRPYEPRDAGVVLALNQSHLDAVGPLDAARQEWLVDMTEACLVVQDGEELMGFVMTLPPGTVYDSPNYRWFSDRYDSFSYLDRVVVADSYQRQGIGRLLYDAVEATARPRGRIALEVYAEPPNVGSLAFHGTRGYVEVGRTTQANGKVCAMFVKELR
jgi:predicted GNAT superfamily acetyltransferase